MNSGIRGARHAQRYITAVTGFVACAVLLFLAVLITAATLVRYTGVARVAGAHELAGYAQVALVYVGLAAAFNKGQFIQVELLYGRAKGLLRQVLMVWNHLLALTVVTALTVYSWRLVAEAYERGIRSVGELRLVLYPFFAIVVLGLALLGMQILLSLVTAIFGRGAQASEPNPVSHKSSAEV